MTRQRCSQDALKVNTKQCEIDPMSNINAPCTTKISEFTEKGFSNSPWKFHQNILIASKITAFTTFYSVEYFKPTPKKLSHLSNVQCLTSLTSLSQSTFETSDPAFSFTQAQSFFVKLGMALLIESCDSWSRINCKTFFSPSVFFALGWNVLVLITPQAWYSKGLTSGDFGTYSPLLINSLPFVTIQSWANVVVWAGAPTCWKVKPDGRRHSLISLSGRILTKV